MGPRERLRAATARQLGHPSGWRGRLIGRALNRSNRALVDAAIRAGDVQPGQVAADVGFGGGVGLGALLEATRPGGHVHGVDLSATMVDRARAAFADACTAGRLEVSQGSLLDLPLDDDTLDVVITTNTVYFLDDVEPAFRELARVLRPGGRVVVGIGDPDEMARMPVTAHGFHIRPVEELLEAMRAGGLVGVRSEELRVGSDTAHLLVGHAALGADRRGPDGA